jgi:hypothetical protein
MTAPDDEQPDGEGPPQTYTPWLVVRATPSDNGSRPLGAGAVYWASPDLSATPADAWGRVNAGAHLTVTVTVQNLGHAAINGVRAHFWWLNPAAGLGPGQGNDIGTSDRVSIAAGLSETLVCTNDWVPQFVNGGHECLMVEVSALADPLTSTFRPDLDRHVAQRNLTVLPPEGEPQQMQLRLTNPFSERNRTTVHLTTTRLFGAEHLVGFGLPLAPINALVHSTDPSLRDPLSAAGIEHDQAETGTGVVIGGIVDTGRQTEVLDDATQRLLRERRVDGHNFGPVVGRIDLDGGGTALLSIAAMLGGVDNAVLVHHFTQVSDGVDVGGYTVTSLPF